MLAFCSHKLWGKLDNPIKTTDLEWAITTLPHASNGDQTWAAMVTKKKKKETSERHTSVLGSIIFTSIQSREWLMALDYTLAGDVLLFC